MTKYRFLTAAAWAALASMLAASPAMAQDPDRGRAWGREARAEAQAEASNNGEQGQQRETRAAPAQPRTVRGGPGTWSAPRAQAGGQVSPDAGAAAHVRNDSGHNRDWAARQGRDAAAQQRSNGTWANPGNRGWAAHQGRDQAAQQRSNGTWASPGDRGEWQRDRSYGARGTDWQRDRHEDARRDERRDDARNYGPGYRDGRHVDQRWDNRRDGNHWDSRTVQNHRQWDNRAWRNDRRYDWYRHRATNHSLYRLGRYYAPHRGYSYSRIGIGFRLGSGFYSNRYWINDPWRYRLPDVYGPYRWVRYYDDALLVDVYSGQVVDVIYNFFW